MAAPKTTDGRPRVAYEKPNTPKVTIVSHDWTDPTTWYGQAVRVVAEVATDSGDHLTYALAHQNIIDTYHGKISQEDFLFDADSNSYRVAVTVDDVEVAEQDPHFGADGDFTVNYAAGTITFLEAQDPGAEVKVTHHYATTSVFTLAPSAGKILEIEFAEVQFSLDVEVNDTVVFQPYGYVDAFAPQYAYHLGDNATFTNGSTAVTGTGLAGMAGRYVRLATSDPEDIMLVAAVESDEAMTLAAPYTGDSGTAALLHGIAATCVYPSLTKIPLGNPVKYKSMSDYQNDAVKAYSTYPVMGGAGWRGSQQEMVIMDWDYVSATPISSAAGMEVRIFLEHDTPFGGFYGTATFYCSVHEEIA